MLIHEEMIARVRQLCASDDTVVAAWMLWFARLAESTTEHWPTPSKNVERELSQPAYNRYRACTASPRGCELEDGYQEAWAWGKDLARVLASEHGLDTEEALVQRLDARFLAVFTGEQVP